MKLYYYKDQHGNFGDDLNPWLWNKLIPELLDDNESELFVGIGTLLNHRIPAAAKKIVFGSGAGYGEAPVIDQKWRFYCVRGPLTARKLGLDSSLALTDPAILMTDYLSEFDASDNHRKVSYMPHHESMDYADWKQISESAGLRFIDPGASLEQVVGLIRHAKLLVTEAMHGAIMADAMRVPWIPVSCYEHIFEFKWQDWCQSLGVDYQPVKLAPVWDAERHVATVQRVKNTIKRGLSGIGIHSSQWTPPPPVKSTAKHVASVTSQLSRLAHDTQAMLSDDRVLAEVIEKLKIKLDQLRRDFS